VAGFYSDASLAGGTAGGHVEENLSRYMDGTKLLLPFCFFFCNFQKKRAFFVDSVTLIYILVYF
jgi:hypothetical protein